MTETVTAFLERTGWGGAEVVPLAGDASSRRYLRLRRPDGTPAILMIAPVATGSERASLSAFRRIGVHLRGLGLSAPLEIAAAPEAGLILMEDLGDETLAHLLDTGAPEAEPAYRAAAGLLPVIAGAPPPGGLAAPGPDALARMTDVTFDLLPGAADLRVSLMRVLADALADHAGGTPVLSLRDVHGDNLLWLPRRPDHAKIGLLDFQDALLLPAGYDLASLIDDVRRDVPRVWREFLVEEFAREVGLDPVVARCRVDLLSLQRNLRILGVFRRLATRRGKPGYATFLPRTRARIETAVANPALGALAAPVAELLDRTAGWSEVAA